MTLHAMLPLEDPCCPPVGQGQAGITAPALAMHPISSNLYNREPQCPLISDVDAIRLPSS